MKAKAAVLVADNSIETREIEVPDGPPPGGALLAVEGCGMCGSDVKQYHGGTARAGIMSYPVIPGHERVGRIAAIDPDGARCWGLKEGDRVAVHLVCDTTPYALQPIHDAINAVRPGGRIVLSGLKDSRSMDGFPIDTLMMKQIRMTGVLASGHWATQQAIRVIESGRLPLGLMHTHSLPIEQLERGIRTLAGEIPGERALRISILAQA